MLAQREMEMVEGTEVGALPSFNIRWQFYLFLKITHLVHEIPGLKWKNVYFFGCWLKSFLLVHYKAKDQLMESKIGTVLYKKKAQLSKHHSMSSVPGLI